MSDELKSLLAEGKVQPMLEMLQALTDAQEPVLSRQEQTAHRNVLRELEKALLAAASNLKKQDDDSFAASFRDILKNADKAKVINDPMASSDHGMIGAVALKDYDLGNVYIVSAKVLGELRDKTAIPLLIQTLKNKNPQVRGAAALALGKIGDLQAREPLRQQIIVESSWAFEALALALTELDDFEYAVALIDLENQSGFINQDRRIAALERWGTPEALEAVRRWRTR